MVGVAVGGIDGVCVCVEVEGGGGSGGISTAMIVKHSIL